MNPVAEYIKNLGKSATYATIQHISEKAPATASFAESNQELYKEVYNSLRNYKTTLQRAKTAMQNTAVYKLGDLAFNNAMADIKSGKLYNKEREESSFEDFGNFGADSGSDLEKEFGDGEGSTGGVTQGDQLVVKTVNDSSRKNAYAVSNAVASSTEYIVNTQKSIANVQYAQATHAMNTIQSGFRGLSSGIDAIYKFDTEVIGTHVENSKKYFETTTNLLNEQNAILKEMLQMQREKYKTELKQEKKSKSNRFDDVVDAHGTPNIKSYMKAVGGNFKSAVDEQSGGMLGMLTADNLKIFANNPMAFVPQFVMASLIGPKLNTAIKKFDSTLAGAFSTMTAKMSKMGNDENSNPFQQFIGKVFGLKNNVKSGIDTSKYEQGSMQWNGIAQKSLVEVIPGYLSKIEALLSGQNERLFDFKNGKWTNGRSIKEGFKNIKKSNVRTATSDVSEEMLEMVKTLSFTTKKDKEDFLKDMQSMLGQIYEDYGHFNPNDKNIRGVYSNSNTKMLQGMFKNLRRSTKMGMANNVQSQRESHNRNMEQLEKDGNSQYNNLFNGSNIDSHIKTNEDTGEIIKVLGNLGDKSNILKVKDDFKKNIFDYLRAIDQNLFVIRKTGGTGSGGRKKGKGGLNYSQLTDEDWTSYFEKGLGPKEKSDRQIKTERERNNESNYKKNETERVKHIKTNGGLITENVNSYMDSTVHATSNLGVHAALRNHRDNKRAMDSNSTWLTDMMAKSAKESKSRLDASGMTGTEKKQGMSFLDQLIHAGSLGAKWDVISNGISNLTAKPADILTGVLTKADENIYNFFYGEDTGEKDSTGKKIKGFFNRMVFDMQKTFGKVNSWIDDTLLKPYKDKFGGKSVWGATKNALKGVGVDIDGMKQKAKGYLTGDNGILRPTIDAVKKAYSDTYQEIKNDMKKSYKDANQFYHNTVRGEETSEQKTSRIKKTTGVDNIDESAAYKHAVESSGINKRHSRQREKYLNDEIDILNELNSTKDPKKRRLLEKKLQMAYSQPSDLVSNKVKEFGDRQNKIKQLSSSIGKYKQTDRDSRIVSSRNSDTSELNRLKGILNISGNASDIDIKSPEYAHLGNSGTKEILDQALALEKRVGKSKTGLERLRDKKSNLESTQKQEWNKTGTTHQAVMSNPNFVMAQAKLNGKGSPENKAYGDALKSLATILGLATTNPQAQVAYKTIDALSKEYFKAIEGLGKGDPLKNVKVEINKANSIGDESSSSKLIQQMNDIIASKGSLLGRFTNTFSDVLGKMHVPQEQISSIVDKIINGNPIETLNAMNKDVDSFITAVKKINPSLNLESYGKVALSNYAEQGKYTPFKEDVLDRGDYTKDNADVWRDEHAFADPESRGNYALPDKIHKYAKGSYNVPQTGLTVLSKGERVIPSDENIYNPNLKNADKKKDAKNEEQFKNSLGLGNISSHADGTDNFQPGALTQGINNFKSGTGQFINQVFDNKETSTKLGKVNEEVRKHLPRGIGGGLVGGTVGLLTGIGGPLLGAIAGSALSVVSGSETFQKSLFGEKIYDAEGNDTGKRGGGMFSSDFQETVKKYLPDTKAYGITGTVLGMLTPLGPLGGLMMGSAIAFAKNNQHLREKLFGSEDGLLNDDRKKAIQKAFPNVAAATLGMMFLGPFGLLGNAALGSGIGLASTTDEFKDMMLGKADKDGKRVGGLSGALKNSVIDPLAKMASSIQSTLGNFIKKDMIDPLKRSIAPLGKQLALAVKDTFKGIGSSISWLFKSALGVPLVQKVIAPLRIMAKPFMKPIKALGKGIVKGAGKLISSPFKAVGWLGNKAREHQIKKSNADYMTASERLEFMGDRNKNYDLKDYDQLLTNTNKGDLEKMHNLMGEMQGGKKFLDEKHGEYKKDLDDTVLAHGSKYKWDHFTSQSILKAAQSGNMEKVHSLIQESNLGTADKAKLAKDINEKSGKLREIRSQKENYSGDQNKILKDLQDKYGMKGINDKNMGKYRSVLQTEIQSRHPEGIPETAEDKQLSNINSSLDANTDKLNKTLEEQVKILSEIRDGSRGITPKQRVRLNNAKLEGEVASASNSNYNDSIADKRNSHIAKLYGVNQLDDRHRYTLSDDDYKYNTLKNHKLGGNINDILDLDNNTIKRATIMHKAGYHANDYDKLKNLSDAGFNNVSTYTKGTGRKITDFDSISNAHPDLVKKMVNLHKAGYQDASQGNLMKMANTSQKYMGKGIDHGIGAQGINPDERKSSDILNKDGEAIKVKSIGAKIADAIMSALTDIGELPGFAEGGNITKGGLAVVSKGERIESTGDGSNKSISQVPTPDGIETYTKTDDGSMRMSHTKDNELIQKKITSRDDVQKGILDNLKIIAGTAGAKGKNGLKSVAKAAKGGLLGALGGLMSLLNPVNMLKSIAGPIGNLLMMPFDMLGLGGIARKGLGKLGGMAMGALKGVGKGALGALKFVGGKMGKAVGWAGGKIGAGAGKLTDKFLGTKMGGKLTSGLEKFGASKVGKGLGKVGGVIGKGLGKVGGVLGKGASAVGRVLGIGGGPTGSAIDENGMPAGEPNDVLGAINLERTTLVSYLQQICDLLSNGGVGGASDLVSGAKNILTKGGEGALAKEGEEAIVKGGEGALAKGGESVLAEGAAAAGAGGMLAKGVGAIKGVGSLVKGKTVGFLNSTIGKLGGFKIASASAGAGEMVGGKTAAEIMSPKIQEVSQKAQVFLSKAKGAISSFVAKLEKWIPSKKAYAAIGDFCAKLFQKIETPEVLTKVVKRLGGALALGPAFAAVGVATGGVGTVVLEAAEGIGWFLYGWSHADEMLGIKSGSSTGMKFAAGLVDGVLNMIPIIGWALPGDIVLDLSIDTIGPAFGFTRADVNKLKQVDQQADQQAQSAISDSKSQNGGDPTGDNNNNGGTSFWDKTKKAAGDAWNSAKQFGSNVWNGAKNFANYAIQKGSDAVNYVKNTGSAVASWVGDKAQSGANAVKGFFGGNSNSNSSGNGKYGRAKGRLGKMPKYGRGGFNSQLDPANAMNFNAPGDTTSQTMEDSGCGPVSATNMASALGVNADPKSAASYALSKGYKEKDGGTKPGYFGDYLGKYGIGTTRINSSDSVKDNLSSGNPVLLMGKDNKGANNSNPFGQYNHYVVGTGMDGKGNIVVQDPESKTPNHLYKANNVLGKSSIAIAASKQTGGNGKYGRAKGRLGKMPKYGRGADTDNGAIAFQFLTSKGFSNQAAAGICGNLMVECPGLDPTTVQGSPPGHASEIKVDGSTGYGICQWTYGSRQQGLVDFAAKAGKSTSDLQTQLDYMLSEMSQDMMDQLNSVQTAEEAAKIFCSQFESPDSAESHLDQRQSYATQFFQNQGKGVSNTGSAAKSGSNGSKDANTNKYSGLFGAVAQAGDQLTSKFGQMISPLSGAVASGAASVFGAKNISSIFGDTNPFSGVLSGGSQPGSNGGAPGSGGNANFNSASTDAGIKAASNWAAGLVASDEVQPYGSDGCTAFARDYLQHAGNKFADQMDTNGDMYVPTLWKNAQQEGIWKGSDQKGAEGDIALVDTDANDPSEPSHAIISDGQGGFFGNSSSTLKVKHGNIADTFGADKLAGYVATGDQGGGAVVTGQKTNNVDIAAEAGPTSGGGKYGRGKFGLGKPGNNKPIKGKPEKGKFGKGLPNLNSILGPNNSNLNMIDTIAKNIIDPNSKKSQLSNTTLLPNQQFANPRSNTGISASDYSQKLDSIISILSTIATALTGKPNTQTPASTNTLAASKPAAANRSAMLNKLSSMGNGSQNGIGDMFANRDNQSIISAMNSVATL